MKRTALIWVALFGIALFMLWYFDPQHYHFPRCPFLWFTGYRCPGCGSQRAIHQLLHGHITEAARLNALFIPGIVYSGAGFLLSAFLPRHWPAIQQKWFGKKAAYIAFIVIMLFWIGRNLL